VQSGRTRQNNTEAEESSGVASVYLGDWKLNLETFAYINDDEA
jgi:hypothetical protein